MDIPLKSALGCRRGREVEAGFVRHITSRGIWPKNLFQALYPFYCLLSLLLFFFFFCPFSE
jgi:hypothetical protein